VFYKHCCHSLLLEDHTDYCLSRQEELEQLKKEKDKIQRINKQPSREKLIEFLWEHSYGKFINGEIGEEYEEYPEYLADQLFELFESSKETA
jgi:hypothetical protein